MDKEKEIEKLMRKYGAVVDTELGVILFISDEMTEEERALASAYIDNLIASVGKEFGYADKFVDDEDDFELVSPDEDTTLPNPAFLPDNK